MPATTSSMAGGFPPPNPNGAAMTQLNMSSMPTNVSHTHGYTNGSQVVEHRQDPHGCPETHNLECQQQRWQTCIIGLR
jgi:hypothetical protein